MLYGAGVARRVRAIFWKEKSATSPWLWFPILALPVALHVAKRRLRERLSCDCFEIGEPLGIPPALGFSRPFEFTVARGSWHREMKRSWALATTGQDRLAAMIRASVCTNEVHPHILWRCLLKMLSSVLEKHVVPFWVVLFSVPT